LVAVKWLSRLKLSRLEPLTSPYRHPHNSSTPIQPSIAVGESTTGRMNLDTELQRMFESLTDRLRDEIARQLSEAVGEVAGAARTDREAAINDAVARTRLEVERDAAARLHEEIAAAEAKEKPETKKP